MSTYHLSKKLRITVHLMKSKSWLLFITDGSPVNNFYFDIFKDNSNIHTIIMFDYMVSSKTIFVLYISGYLPIDNCELMAKYDFISNASPCSETLTISPQEINIDYLSLLKNSSPLEILSKPFNFIPESYKGSETFFYHLKVYINFNNKPAD